MRRWACVLLVLFIWGCDDDDPAAESDGTPAMDAEVADAMADPAADAAVADMAVADATPPPEWADPGPVIDPETAMAYVDPFIGSGGLGYGYAAMTPAAQMPLGMMRLGPDTTMAGNHVVFHHFSGYHHDDPDVRGFSHVRLVGTGVADLGLFRVLPQAALEGPAPNLRYAPMDKATETAVPGRYGVRLTDPPVDVDLTVTAQAGVHRYTFAESGRVYLIVNPAASITDRPVRDARVAWADGRLTGLVDWQGGFTGRTHGFQLAVDAVVDPPPAAVFAWDGAQFVEGAEATGDAAALALAFDDVADVPIELRVGISYIDGPQAERNRTEQLADSTFDDVAAAAWAAWREKIGKVRVAGGTERDRTVFYTAQYHAYAMPTQFSEAGGRYRGLDDEVHDADGFDYLTDLSLWDTFRTLHPWYELTDVDAERNSLRSLMAMFEDGGFMPRWPANTSYAGSMIGTSADMLFAGGQAKGIDGVDYEAAFDALMVAANQSVARAGRNGIEEYIELGYVPEEVGSGSVSRTLEYTYSDGILAEFATRLGRPEAEALAERGLNYRNLFDAESGFFFPRGRDGEMRPVSPEAITMGEGPYVEGNAWHWRFSPLHDPEGLAELFGGPTGFGDVLDRHFDLARLGLPGFTPTIPDVFYWHGNEPTIHHAFLYHHTDRPWRVAEQVRRIQLGAYFDAPGGLVGNDDGGTLSAWLLFTAVGLYPVAGTDRYYLASPLFPRVELDHAAGTLTVEAWGASPEVMHYGAALLDDAPIGGPMVTHAELLEADTLRFEMIERPAE